jgi:arsenate reductase-like glutaredoxin family protein
MKTDRLESFVNENRHEFDRMEPSDELWKSISKRLEEQDKPKIRHFSWVRVAAIIAVFIAIPAIIYQVRNSGQMQTAKAVQIDPQVQELIEAEAYYSQEVSGKLAEIQKCYKIYPELKGEVEGDLNELEKMYRSLKSDLKDNISNKEVIEAMIENNRNRLKLVDEVLEQINC